MDPLKEQPVIDVRLVKTLATDAVLRLYRAAGWWQDGDDEGAIPGIVSGSFLVVGAFLGNELVGMGRVLSDGASDAYIQDVVVLPAARGSGVGSRMVEALRDGCLERGLRWIALVGEPGTTDFYTRLGFMPQEGYVFLKFGLRESEK
jgi:GNAT superfamily N-acetyltransferase